MRMNLLRWARVIVTVATVVLIIAGKQDDP